MAMAKVPSNLNDIQERRLARWKREQETVVQERKSKVSFSRFVGNYKN